MRQGRITRWGMLVLLAVQAAWGTSIVWAGPVASPPGQGEVTPLPALPASHTAPEPTAPPTPARPRSEGIELTEYLHHFSTNVSASGGSQGDGGSTKTCLSCGHSSDGASPCNCDDSSKTKSKYPTVSVTGFFHADGLWFTQDTANREAVNGVHDVADFRRARLAAKGDVADNVSYMIEFDFAFPGRPSFMDVWLDISDLPIGHFRVGQWRQPFCMDALTSVRELTFFERALPFAFVPFRQTGIGFYDTALDEHMTWAVSGYRFPTNVFGNVFGDDGYGVSVRVTGLLHSDPELNQNTHVGVAYTWNEPATGFTQIRTAPEVGFTQLDFRDVDFEVPFFVDTGQIPSHSYQVLGFELAQSFGPLVLQSELMYAWVGQTGGPSVMFPGMYAQASYVLTGERREYNRNQGVFDGVNPANDFGKHGWGAWEVAARWSYLDLNDNNVLGGRLEDLTFGLNWYLNTFTKFQFQYVRSWLDSPVNGDSACSIFGVRTQLDF